MILPGVGAFPMMHGGSCGSRGLDQAILHVRRGKSRILGICLGMQLLLDSSTEMRCAAVRAWA